MHKDAVKMYKCKILKYLIESGIYKKANEKAEAYEKEQCRQLELLDRYYELEDRWYSLLDEGINSLKATHPKIEEIFPELCREDNKMTNILNICKEMKNPDNVKMQIVRKAFDEIPALIEASKTEAEMQSVGMERLLSTSKCFRMHTEMIETLFSDEYNEKLDSFADEGIFLYHYITPSVPPFDVSKEDILDYFFEFDLPEYIDSSASLNHKGRSLERKIEDVYETYFLIKNGFYRSAVRNLFSLIESEHKKGAKAFEGFLKKPQEYKCGKERSEKLNELFGKSGFEWEKRTWKKIEKYYKKMLANEPKNGVTHRNSIVHGDYESDFIEVTRYDAIKLFTLLVNIKLLSDRLCRASEDMEMIFSQVIINLAGTIDNC